MMKKIKTIGLDADDTLWHNEPFFGEAQAALIDVLKDFVDGPDLASVLLEMQRRNVPTMGYGIKSFTFSMMDAALAVSGGHLDAAAMNAVLNIGREMMAHPVTLLPEVAETLEEMAREHELVLITKGDLVDQERKVQLSEVGNWFSHIEIVSEKHPQTYETIFGRFGPLDQSVMIGNSAKSDALPAVQAGAWGIHVPYAVTWELEMVEVIPEHPRYFEADDIVHAAKIIRDI
jgi:putative hydrolase of the HAD superfamily